MTPSFFTKISRFIFFFTINSLLLLTSKSYGQMVKPYEQGIIHEGFVSKDSGNLIFDAIPAKPPEPIGEKVPRQLDLQAEWVPGYWSYEAQSKDFVWVSGVWRRPPPGHQWVAGFWKQYNEGWVWIPGFWSKTPPQSLEYIGVLPPDPIDEHATYPPTENYFWVPGYWHFSFEKQEYQWVKGFWEELDASWVLVPSHYNWQPGGYVFIPAYWDWPLENRGTAYAAVLIESNFRHRISYEPDGILKPEKVIRTLFPSYPNYATLFHHHWRFHSHYWGQFCCPPPWWRWDTWWSITWDNQWSLWWWYTHPGYPKPSWMTEELSGILPPPLSELVVMLENSKPPAIVSPGGVLPRGDLLQAAVKVSGQFLPIIPSDPRLASRVYEIAQSHMQPAEITLRPIGRSLPIDPHAVRPSVRKPVIRNSSALRVNLADENYNSRLPFKPKIPAHGRSSLWKIEASQGKEEIPVYNPPMRRPSWAPRPASSRSSQEISGHQMKNRDRQESQNPQRFREWHPMKPVSPPHMNRPPIHTPAEGNIPK